MKNYYDLNGLLTFSIDATKKKLKYIDRQYCYFRTKAIENVDLEIKVGDFDSIDIPFSIVNRKYLVNEDCIFGEDSYKVAKWKFLIKGLKNQHTTVYFSGNYWSYYILYKFFIEPLLRFKLNERGYFMVHSSAVATENGALIFPASPSVGKTSTMLNWLNEGKQFIADEFTILDNKYAYSYPTPLRLHDYNLTANPFIKKNMKGFDKFQIYLRTWIFRLTFGYGDITHEVNIWDIFPDIKIAKKAPINAVIIFTKSSEPDVQVEQLTKEEFLERLIIINRFETTRFTDYLQAYDYVNNVPSKEQFWMKMKQNGEKSFQDDTYYALKIPKNYTKKTFEQINLALEKITK